MKLLLKTALSKTLKLPWQEQNLEWPQVTLDLKIIAPEKTHLLLLLNTICYVGKNTNKHSVMIVLIYDV